MSSSMPSPAEKKEFKWTASLFSCFRRPDKICLKSFLCCPRALHDADDPQSPLTDKVYSDCGCVSYRSDDCLYCLFALWGCLALPMIGICREDFRKERSIAGSLPADCIISCCCPCCTVHQMVVERRNREVVRIQPKETEESKRRRNLLARPTPEDRPVVTNQPSSFSQTSTAQYLYFGGQSELTTEKEKSQMDQAASSPDGCRYSYVPLLKESSQENTTGDLDRDVDRELCPPGSSVLKEASQETTADNLSSYGLQLCSPGSASDTETDSERSPILRSPSLKSVISDGTLRNNPCPNGARANEHVGEREHDPGQPNTSEHEFTS